MLWSGARWLIAPTKRVLLRAIELTRRCRNSLNGPPVSMAGSQRNVTRRCLWMATPCLNWYRASSHTRFRRTLMYFSSGSSGSTSNWWSFNRVCSEIWFLKYRRQSQYGCLCQTQVWLKWQLGFHPKVQGKRIHIIIIARPEYKCHVWLLLWGLSLFDNKPFDKARYGKSAALVLSASLGVQFRLGCQQT